MTEPTLEDQLAGALNSIGLLQEALADVEASFAREDAGWTALGSKADQFTHKFRTARAADAVAAAAFDPLLKRALNLRAAYIWAGGVQVSTRDDAEAGQDVNAVVRAFWGDEDVQQTFSSVQALIKRTWEPTLSVTGAEGLPALKDAGNVLRPYTAFKLSLRTPPTVDAGACVAEMKRILEDNAPYHARVTFHVDGAASGWNAPAVAPWLAKALDDASQAQFGAPCGYIGQGGTIPLMNILSQGFPSAQMVVCGVLGPRSNAHGPNEFLHLPYAKRLTAAVAQVLASMP